MVENGCETGHRRKFQESCGSLVFHHLMRTHTMSTYGSRKKYTVPPSTYYPATTVALFLISSPPRPISSPSSQSVPVPFLASAWRAVRLSAEVCCLYRQQSLAPHFRARPFRIPELPLVRMRGHYSRVHRLT